MNKLKYIGKLMTCGGGLLAPIMLIVLARSFSAVPEGASPTVLAEAITPWNLFAAIGGMIFILGLISWIVGSFYGRRNRKNKQWNDIENRLKAVERKTNLA